MVDRLPFDDGDEIGGPAAAAAFGSALSGLLAARAAGDAGSTRAGEHADRQSAAWSARAAAGVLAFARLAGGAWLLEDARQSRQVRDLALPDPPDGRAWGHVVRLLVRAGQIEAAGYAAARSSNGSPKVLWRRVGG